MRFLTTIVLASTLALPAMAQTSMNGTSTDQAPAASDSTHHRAMGHRQARRMARAKRDMVEGASATGRPGHPTANDKGPFTADADKAYMGGGAILEGQPGGPPPPASAVLSMPQNGQMPMQGGMQPMQGGMQPMRPMR